MASSVPDPDGHLRVYPSSFPAPNSAPQSEDSLGENPRVMIIDDDPFFRGVLKVLLQQAGLPDPEVLEAEDSNTAVTICKNKSVDLIFCDLHLPPFRSKNGLEIIRELRQFNRYVPVYMVTAENSESLIRRVCAAGATGHILKPVSLLVLKRIVSSLKIEPEVD